MANDENGEKTEQPTDHRRQQVREQGNVARSTDLNAAAVMLAIALGLQFWGVSLLLGLSDMLNGSLTAEPWLQLDVGRVMHELARHAVTLARQLLPFMLLLMAAALLANFAQVGFHITTEALEPRLSRLNPLSGFQRILSAHGLIRLGGSLAKLLVLTTVSLWFMWSHLGAFLSLTDVSVAQAGTATGESLVLLAFWLAGALLVLAAIDYGFQYWKFEQDIRMTRQEVRDEMRQMEGDPQIRMRRREAHRKLAQSRQMQQVPGADVVVTNPTHISVAIKYEPARYEAPIVVAKGQDEVALRIRQIAAEHGVPIVEKRDLARALYQRVKVGHPVPVELYEVVAEILAYVYRLGSRKKRAA